MIKRPLSGHVRYTRFIASRDRALEVILSNALSEIDDITREAFTQAKGIVASQYSAVVAQFFFTNGARNTIQSIDHSIDLVFHGASMRILDRIKRLRRNSFLLSWAGEVEAVSRARGEMARAALPRHRLTKVADSKTRDGEQILNRLLLGFNRVRREIIDAVELSRVMEDPIDLALSRVDRAFPKRTISGTAGQLRRVKEADKKQGETDFSDLFIDDSEWEDMLDSYKSQYVPKWRAPGEQEKPDDDERYSWEVEQDIKQDFVSKVQNGQHSAAKQMGIDDFVFIAVVDDKTDECCLWRDGKLLSEIKEEIGEDFEEEEDEGCKGLVPPLHFNCRCRIAPYTDTKEEAPTLGDFDEWLAS
jgi:hypothetical protein